MPCGQLELKINEAMRAREVPVTWSTHGIAVTYFQIHQFTSHPSKIHRYTIKNGRLYRECLTSILHEHKKVI